MQKLLLAFASLSTLALAACGPVQSPECAAYIACQRAIDQDQGTSSADSLEAAYGETGTCWSSTAEYAQNCTNACVDALDSRAASYPEIDECQPGADEG